MEPRRWGPGSRPARPGSSPGTRPDPRETGVKRQRALSDEEERVRVEGLRILARLIARHALAHTELSEGGRGDEGPEPPASDEGATGGPPERTDDAA